MYNKVVFRVVLCTRSCIQQYNNLKTKDGILKIVFTPFNIPSLVFIRNPEAKLLPFTTLLVLLEKAFVF